MKLNERCYRSVACCLFALVAVLVLYPGCRKKSEAPRTFDSEIDDDVLTILGTYPPAQGIARIDNEGRYDSLKALVAKKLLKEEFVKAMDSHEAPVPFGGYLVAEIEKDEQGEDLSRRSRAGICAYPAPKDKSSKRNKKAKKPLILVLMNVDDFRDCSYYECLTGETRPMRQWPTKKELEDGFARMEKRVSSDLKDAALRIGDQSPPEL